MSDLEFKRTIYLFIRCTTLFPKSYYGVSSRHLNFVDDIERFKNYYLRINMYKEFLRELELCNGDLTTIKVSMVVDGGEIKQRWYT